MFGAPDRCRSAPLATLRALTSSSLTSLSRRRLSQAVVLMAVSTLVAALCWQAAGPSPALRQTRQHAASMTVVDLFPDPPSVAGVVIKAKDSNFPSVLEQPAEIAKYIPMPDFDPSDVLFAPLEVPDLFTALFVRRRVKSARSAGATARWSDGLGPTHPARGRQRACDDPLRDPRPPRVPPTQLQHAAGPDTAARPLRVPRSPPAISLPPSWASRCSSGPTSSSPRRASSQTRAGSGRAGSSRRLSARWSRPRRSGSATGERSSRPVRPSPSGRSSS